MSIQIQYIFMCIVLTHSKKNRKFYFFYCIQNNIFIIDIIYVEKDINWTKIERNIKFTANLDILNI